MWPLDRPDSHEEVLGAPARVSPRGVELAPHDAGQRGGSQPSRKVSQPPQTSTEEVMVILKFPLFFVDRKLTALMKSRSPRFALEGVLRVAPHGDFVSVSFVPAKP